MKRISELPIFLFQFTICIAFAGFALYSYLTEQNRCTEIKMRLPKLAKEIEALQQENVHLQYQIVSFESPENLLHLARAPAYSHLKFPFFQDVLTLKEGLAIEWVGSEETVAPSKPKPSVVVGASTVN